MLWNWINLDFDGILNQNDLKSNRIWGIWWVKLNSIIRKNIPTISKKNTGKKRINIKDKIVD